MNKILLVLNLILAALFLSWAANNLATETAEANAATQEAEFEVQVGDLCTQLDTKTTEGWTFEAWSPTFGWVQAPESWCLRMAWQAVLEKDGLANGQAFLEAIAVNELHEEFAPLLAAIRLAENGRAGREFGILHPRVEPTYRSQAGWAAATVRKNYGRWDESQSELGFIEFLGARYAPIGADNDPNGLNAHWVQNVSFWTKEIGNSHSWELRRRCPLTGAIKPL